MKLKELAKKIFAEKKIRKPNQMIGICELDNKGKVKPVYPEYADEILETYGAQEVANWAFSDQHQLLVVTFVTGITFR